MGRKSKNIVSFTADELKAKEQNSEDRTDLKKAARAVLPDGSDPRRRHGGD